MTIRRLIASALTAAGLFFGDSRAQAYAPEGYPGAVWGNASREFSGLDGTVTMGWVRQGVDWFHLPGDIPVKTMASYRWRIRSLNRDFYNSNGPGLGVEAEIGPADLGVEGRWIRYPERDRNFREAEAFLGFYKQWYPGGRDLGTVLGLPFSIWGKLTHDFEGEEGPGAMGWVRQGVEWFRLPGDIVFKTQGSYNVRFRGENRRFYDTHGPSLGVEFSRSPFDLGFQHDWRTFPELKRSTKSFQVYLSWFYAWDLKTLF